MPEDVADDDLFDQLSSSPSIHEDEIDFQYVYALRNFVATEQGQANAYKGDAMILLNDANSYWWLVRMVRDSSVGFLPAEHIETPFERLARLNKHRNGDICSPGTSGMSTSKAFGKMFKSKKKTPTTTSSNGKKSVSFNPNSVYVSASDFEYTDENEDDGVEVDQENGALQEEEDQLQHTDNDDEHDNENELATNHDPQSDEQQQRQQQEQQEQLHSQHGAMAAYRGRDGDSKDDEEADEEDNGEPDDPNSARITIIKERPRLSTAQDSFEMAPLNVAKVRQQPSSGSDQQSQQQTSPQKRGIFSLRSRKSKEDLASSSPNLDKKRPSVKPKSSVEQFTVRRPSDVDRSMGYRTASGDSADSNGAPGGSSIGNLFRRRKSKDNLQAPSSQGNSSSAPSSRLSQHSASSATSADSGQTVEHNPANSEARSVNRTEPLNIPDKKVESPDLSQMGYPRWSTDRDVSIQSESAFHADPLAASKAPQQQQQQQPQQQQPHPQQQQQQQQQARAHAKSGPNRQHPWGRNGPSPNRPGPGNGRADAPPSGEPIVAPMLDAFSTQGGPYPQATRLPPPRYNNARNNAMKRQSVPAVLPRTDEPASNSRWANKRASAYEGANSNWANKRASAYETGAAGRMPSPFNNGRVSPVRNGPILSAAQNGRTSPVRNGRISPQRDVMGGRNSPVRNGRISPQRDVMSGRDSPVRNGRISPQRGLMGGRDSPVSNGRMSPQRDPMGGRGSPTRNGRTLGRQSPVRFTPQRPSPQRYGGNRAGRNSPAGSAWQQRPEEGPYGSDSEMSLNQSREPLLAASPARQDDVYLSEDDEGPSLLEGQASPLGIHHKRLTRIETDEEEVQDKNLATPPSKEVTNDTTETTTMTNTKTVTSNDDTRNDNRNVANHGNGGDDEEEDNVEVTETRSLDRTDRAVDKAITELRSYSSTSGSPPCLERRLDEAEDSLASEQEDTPVLMNDMNGGSSWNGSASSLSLRRVATNNSTNGLMNSSNGSQAVAQKLDDLTLDDLHPDIVPIFKDTTDRLGQLSSKLDQLLKSYR